MTISFSIWFVSGLALVCAHNDGNETSWTPSPQPTRQPGTGLGVDSLGKETAQAFKKAMSDPEKTRERLAAIRPDIQVDEAELNKLKANFANYTPSSNTLNQTLSPYLINQLAGVSPYLLNGDALLTDEQLEYIEQQHQEGGRKKRQAMLPARKWGQRTVYYYFSPEVPTRTRTAVTQGLKYLQQRTCINFKVNATAPNRIKIIDGSGCWSMIGRVGGEQELSLQSNGCDLMGTAAHEFMHAIGFYHEQSRYDRDSYITVDTTYVEPDKVHNFDKQTDTSSINYISYDYGFSTNGEISMYTKKPIFQHTIGSSRIAYSDIRNINMYYGCKPTCTTAQNNIKCKNQGVKNPRNCGVCICPTGYAGADCGTRPNNGGVTYWAFPNATWRSFSTTVGDGLDQTNIRPTYQTKTYWFNVPSTKKLEFKITSINNNQCQLGCPLAGVEFKYGNYPQLVDPVFCCPEHFNKVYSSVRNPTVINVYNHYWKSDFTFEFRHVNRA